MDMNKILQNFETAAKGEYTPSKQESSDMKMILESFNEVAADDANPQQLDEIASVSMSGETADEVAQLIKLLNDAGAPEAAPVGAQPTTMHEPTPCGSNDGPPDMPPKDTMITPKMMDDFENSEDPVEEDSWDNEPDETYDDHLKMTKDLSGGINKRKNSYKRAEPGDNPMAVESSLKEELSKMLKNKMSEKKDQDGDGKHDFDDVQIARMKASGMSHDEAVAKVKGKKESSKKNSDVEIDEAPLTYQDFEQGEDLQKLRNAIDSNKIVSVAFVKKDGTVKQMAIKKNLSSYVPSDRPKTDAQANVQQNNNLKKVIDINYYNKKLKELKQEGTDEEQAKSEAAKKSWRSVSLPNVLGFSVGGQFIDLRDENDIMDRFGEEIYNSISKTMQRSLSQNQETQTESFEALKDKKKAESAFTENSGMKLMKKAERGNRAVKIYKNTEWDEFVLKHYENGEYLKNADYFDDDKESMLDSAEYFLSRSEQVDEAAQTKNPVAKNLNKFNKPQTHKDRKKAEKGGKQKHKKDFTMESAPVFNRYVKPFLNKKPRQIVELYDKEARTIIKRLGEERIRLQKTNTDTRAHDTVLAQLRENLDAAPDSKKN